MTALAIPLRVKVLVAEPIGLLDYSVPSNWATPIEPGLPVLVPLGRRKKPVRGYVVSLETDPVNQDFVLKDLHDIDAEQPTLPSNILNLVLFAARYYGTPPSEFLSLALPPTKQNTTARYQLTDLAKEPGLIATLKPNDALILAAAERFARGFGVVTIQRALQISRRLANNRIASLCRRGLLALVTRRTRNKSKAVNLTQILEKNHTNTEPLANITIATPTAEQASVLATLKTAIAAQTYQTFLLQGVTGSGKTEIYLQAMAYAMQANRTALLLVPEIALTPQLGNQVTQRFGNQVAIVHSGLTLLQRRNEWERVLCGEAKIGLGARSALFLPLQNLGVIVVDEEHDSSFKQDEQPRYNARDLAVLRGQQENAVVILGSATPSLESYANTQTGRYQHVHLTQRVFNKPMPDVTFVDLKEHTHLIEGVFTEPLVTALTQTLSRGEQAILFLNRRGFAPYMFCHDCGHAFRCADCDVSLTWHKSRHVLLCHYCGFHLEAPDTCPACQGCHVGSSGIGTQRVEAAVHALFGNIPVLRLDKDIVRKKRDLENLLNTFRRGEAPILIGTQMVVKGHDFPQVTLVGVIAADASLNFPDFRAAERTFQILTQVAGRAGRGDKPGQVLIQTYETQHYALIAAAKHDYASFIQQELKNRHELNYPPFTRLALVRLEGPKESSTEQAALRVANVFSQTIAQKQLEVMVLGPAAAPLARLRQQFRYQILLKAKNRKDLHTVLHTLPARVLLEGRCLIDIDPINML